MDGGARRKCLKEPVRGTFCGSGLKCFPPLGGTNSETIYYFLSSSFRPNTLKGTATVPAEDLRGKRYQINKLTSVFHASDLLLHDHEFRHSIVKVAVDPRGDIKLSNCPLSLVTASHKLYIHVSVLSLTIKTSQ